MGLQANFFKGVLGACGDGKSFLAFGEDIFFQKEWKEAVFCQCFGQCFGQCFVRSGLTGKRVVFHHQILKPLIENMGVNLGCG